MIVVFMAIASICKAQVSYIESQNPKCCDSIFAIQPFVTTNANLRAEQMEVWIENMGNTSVDAVWVLYDCRGGYINDGRYQLADSAFALYAQRPGYINDYISENKGITIVR